MLFCKQRNFSQSRYAIYDLYLFYDYHKKVINLLDVDIIIGVDQEKTKVEIIESLKHGLGVIDEVRTSNDYSMLTKERYQVDLKFCSVSNFEFLLAFKGNNDFGALLGHLMTPFKLKWSDQGLMLKLKCEGVSNIGTAKADFLLTNNIEKVCNFLGIPYFCLDGKTRLSLKDIFKRYVPWSCGGQSASEETNQALYSHLVSSIINLSQNQSYTILIEGQNHTTS